MMPAGQRLRDKLLATSGMLLFKLYGCDEQGTVAGKPILEPEGEHILHSTCGASRNFWITVATVNNFDRAKQLDTSAMQSAASLVQRYYRRYKARRHYLSIKDKIIKVQASFRRMRVQKQYIQLCAATLVAQKYWRVSKAGRLLQSRRFECTLKHQATASCQADITEGRRFHITEAGSQEHEQWYIDLCRIEAARKIQAAVRLFLSRRNFQAYRRVLIEHAASPNQTFQNKASNRSSDREVSEKTSITIQRYLRGYKIRKAIKSWHNAARVIQHYWRQLHFNKLMHQKVHNEGNIIDGEGHPYEFGTITNASRGSGAVHHLHVKDLRAMEWSGNGKIETASPGLSKHVIDKEKLMSPSFRHKVSRLKQNEEKLQKFAQIFLLHHHIVAQQQRAQSAPPFPPQGAPMSSVTGFVCNSFKVGEGILKDSARYVKWSEGVQDNEISIRGGKEVALDIIALLKTLEQTQKLSCASVSKTNAENVALLLDTDGCILCPQKYELLYGNQYSGHIGMRVALPNVRTFLAVLFALVVYTRTIFHGILFGPTQRQ